MGVSKVDEEDEQRSCAPSLYWWFVMAAHADVMPSAPLVRWVQMIDEHIGEGPMESEVQLVTLLLGPQQQKKFGRHGRVRLFGVMQE